MTEHPPKTILIGNLVYWDWFLKDIVSYFREKYDARFIFFIPTAGRKEQYQAWCADGDIVYAAEDAVSEGEELARSDDEAFEIARHYEEKYGIRYFQDIIQQYRKYSIYFMSYAPKDARAKMVPPSIADITRSINSEFRFFERVLDQQKVDLIIKRPDKSGAACEFIAERKGIPETYWLYSRFKGLVNWGFGPFLESRQLHEVWSSLPTATVPERVDQEVPHYARVNFSNNRAGVSVKKLAKDIFYEVINYAQFAVIDLKNGNFRKKGHRIPMFSRIRFLISQWFTVRKVNRMTEHDINALTANPFVLFLMQLEPELATNSLAREFNNTFAVIQQLSLAMPSGYKLVVKEHGESIGVRRFSFYEDLMRLPNVLFADPSIPGPVLLEHAEAAATVSGTVPTEAARLGKCSLVFSHHAEYEFLPSVIVVKDLFDVQKYVNQALHPRSKEEREKIREEGFRYVEALKELSFEGAGTKMFGEADGLSPEEFERAMQLLIRNFNDQKRLRFANVGNSS